MFLRHQKHQFEYYTIRLHSSHSSCKTRLKDSSGSFAEFVIVFLQASGNYQVFNTFYCSSLKQWFDIIQDALPFTENKLKHEHMVIFTINVYKTKSVIHFASKFIIHSYLGFVFDSDWFNVKMLQKPK